MYKKKEANTEREIKIESSKKIIDDLRIRIEKLEKKIDLNKENESKLAKLKREIMRITMLVHLIYCTHDLYIIN